MNDNSDARTSRHWTAAAGLALLLALGWAAPAHAALPAGGSGPTSDWMGTDPGSYPQTLADVRAEIGADTGSAASLTGAGVGVALIDTGVAPVAGLPATQIVNGPDLSFESQDSDLRYLDAYGHGTHLAGIIVANDKASGSTGLAPKVKLTSIKVGTSNGAVDVTQIMAAIDWVVVHRNDDPANPIRVLNLSYGTSGGHGKSYTDPLQFAVERAWKAGILVVAAAGNSGDNKVANPALDPYVLNVGSACTYGTRSTSDDTISTFSVINGGKRSIDVLAPGESIESLRDPGSYVDTNYPDARVGTTLFRGSGTSQAAAVTSAAAALLLQGRPSLSPDQAKALLVNSATALTGSKGYGEINVAAALAMAAPTGTQTWTASSGYGSLEDARGNSHVTRDGVLLSGDITVWGLLTTLLWVPRSLAKTAWFGGTWMGFRVAGDGWTGTSWASRTWAPAGWSFASWFGGTTSWTDPSWAGHYWSGSAWSGGDWSGHYWSGDTWSAAGWR
ncbi:MAG TPA: S8 family serine peptidase [Rugosimonospora sp.]|nr:S8 family serine peptidase [Rugosimonospora sp.]